MTIKDELTTCIQYNQLVLSGCSKYFVEIALSKFYCKMFVHICKIFPSYITDELHNTFHCDIDSCSKILILLELPPLQRGTLKKNHFVFRGFYTELFTDAELIDIMF
jgi:hypothetical protein